MFKGKPHHLALALGLAQIHACALLAVVVFRPTALDLGLALFGYLWFGFASSLYYHRYLTHRGFDLARPLQWFFLAGGLVGLSGDPVRWVCTHRYHHQHSDQPDDIHSPLDGWFYSHMGWLSRLDMAWIDSIRPLAADVRRVPWLRCWEHPLVAALPHAAYGWALFFLSLALGGDLWGAVGTAMWGLYVPTVASYHFGWMMIASFCHLPQFGYRTGNTPDQSRNIAWLGPLSFGESFHNNHHVYPRRAQHGMAWYEVDASKYLIWALERVGLVRNVVWDFPKHREVPVGELDATAEMVTEPAATAG